jgi:PAS domain S-box-containing protein
VTGSTAETARPLHAASAFRAESVDVNIWQFTAEHGPTTVELLPAFDYKLGWIAGLLAMTGGYALFPAIERVRSAGGAAARRLWLAGGALTMSIGLWGMHWMAMVGFQLPTQFGYEAWIGVASLLPATLGCAGAIHVLAATDPSPLRLLSGTAVLAFGISAMQFVAFEAFQGDVILLYDPAQLGIALLLVFGFAFCALYANLILSRHSGGSLVGRLIGSLVIAVAMLAVHFSGLAAVHFHDNPAIASNGPSGPTAFLIPAIVVAVVMVVGAFWLGSVLDARLDAALDALRDSEARHRAAFETLLDAHFITDDRGIIQYANTAAERIFGYPAAEMLGQRISMLISEPLGRRGRRSDEPVRPPVIAGQRGVFADGCRRKDGSNFPVEICINEFMAGGKRHYSGLIRDLSQSWAADQQMRRLAAAMEHAGEAIAILDADHVIRYVNPQYERQTGYSREEVVGRKPGRNAGNDATYEQLWETVNRGETWTGRLRSRRADGSHYDEQLTVAPVHDADGRISTYVAILRDMSQQLATERQQARLAEAVEHASDVIEILDAQGGIVYVNPAYEKRTGHLLEDVRGSRPEAVIDFSRDQAAYDEMRRTIAMGQPWRGLLRGIDFQGRLIDDDVSVTPVRDERGGIHSYVVVKRDVTEKRALEAQLQRAQKLEAVALLAGGIADEVDAPARQLAGALHLIAAAANGRDSRLPTAIAGEMANCAESLARIREIATALRDLASPALVRTGLNLNRAIQSAITLAASEWRRTAELRTDLDASLPPINCVASDIHMVILNMIVNAAHAIGEKGAGAGLITISTRLLADCAEIRVSDNGTGIDAEIRERIFDPAFTTKPAGKGSGFGLAFAQEVIVREHGGSISLESEPGVGSTFVLRIPLSRSASGAAAAA